MPRSCRSLLHSWIMLSSCRLICASCTQAGKWHTGHSVPTQSPTQDLKSRGKSHYPVEVISCSHHQPFPSPAGISYSSTDKVLLQGPHALVTKAGQDIFIMASDKLNVIKQPTSEPCQDSQEKCSASQAAPNFQKLCCCLTPGNN